uniref:hypothetical protein n=1 Tax=Thaumasiovibrio occultus TaxID=1891184 RepID=UPI000B3599D7|nr:hypothetical protein [Thaumasiovibrio occultus]
MNIEDFVTQAKPHLVRSVSKNGDFDLAYGYLVELKGTLNSDQVIELYEYIRDNSDRIEIEWRDEFIEFFEEFEDDIPEPQL